MRRRVTAALVGAALALAGPAAAQQFSADVVNSDNGTPPRPAGKVYVADGKVRMENQQGGKSGTLLIDVRANTAYILMPQQKMYMDAKSAGGMGQAFMPLDADDPCPSWLALEQQMKRNQNANWTCKRIGADTVDGRSTVKYEAASDQGETHDLWVDPKLKFMVKSASQTGQTMTLENIAEAPQPASLFELPADYQKMDMQQMMQQMMQQRGGAKP